MLPILCALIVAGAVLWAGRQMARALQRPPDSDRQSATLLALFAPAVAAAAADPRAIVAWQPLAATARTLYPKQFAELDRACGSTFPFSTEAIERAHARWTADWLAWEKAHDATYKLKALVAQQELHGDTTSPVARARLDAVEREKLELYQRRYEEYVRVGKALHGLV